MSRRTIAIACSLLIAAMGAGYLLGSARSRPTGALPATGPAAAPDQAAPTGKQIYTCSMHPQVRLDQPGNCPICQMPLILAVSASPATGEAPMLQLSEHALAMASVETVAVERRALSRDLRAVGRIQYNESSLATITPRVDGFAERLFVSFTGVEIRKGDHLAEVYSPELLVAQQELLIALQSGAGNSLAEVAKTKLRLLGLTDQQVANLVEKQQTTDRVTLYSPISGTVIEKNIVEKSSFKAGDALYRIANLDTVWIYLDIYEYDLPWVRYGQSVRITAQAIPGRTFTGVVTFVQPIVDDLSRTVRVPVFVDNMDHTLKPGMFVTAEIAASLTDEGRAAPTGIEGRYTCQMHPQVLMDAPGACPVCQMPLEKIPEDTEDAPSQGRPAVPGEGAGVLAVPVSAVLDSGTRQIVYIERSRGLFEPRELTLGPRAGEYFAVLSGVAAGDRVVTRGNFLIDSQFQVAGHASLFYPGGLNASMGHQHGGTGVPAASSQPASTDTGATPPAHTPAGHQH